jgi:hypothetical protein
MRRGSFAGLLIAGLALLQSGCLPPRDPFDWSISPRRVEIDPGDEAVFDIELFSKEDINSDVRFAVANVPPGSTAAFESTVLASTANTNELRIQTTAGTPVGTWTLEVTAEEIGHGAYTLTALLIVGASGGPDFTLEVSPAEATLIQGLPEPTLTFYVRPLNGFEGTVDISLDVPDPLLLSQGPSPSALVLADEGGQGGTFVVRLPAGAFVAGDVTLTVTASSGGLVHSGTVLLHLVRS